MKKVKLKLALITFSTFPTIQKNNLLSSTLIFSFQFNKKVILNSLTLLLFGDTSYDNNKKTFKLLVVRFKIFYILLMLAVFLFSQNFIDVTLVSLLLTLNKFTHCSGVSIVNFEQVNAGRDGNE